MWSTQKRTCTQVLQNQKNPPKKWVHKNKTKRKTRSMVHGKLVDKTPDKEHNLLVTERMAKAKWALAQGNRTTHRRKR